jgi:hypothetical protein
VLFIAHREIIKIKELSIHIQAQHMLFINNIPNLCDPVVGRPLGIFPDKDLHRLHPRNICQRVGWETERLSVEKFASHTRSDTDTNRGPSAQIKLNEIELKIIKERNI